MSATTVAPASAPARTPYYRGDPFWGAGRDIGGRPLALYEQLLPQYPDIVRTRFVWINAFLLFNADYAKHVLQTRHDKYVRPDFFRRLLYEVGGVNLFSAEGEVWLAQRKLLNPAFHRRRIRAFGRIMREETERLLAEWEDALWPRDIQDEMTRLTLNIVGRALFSVDMQASGWGQTLTEGFKGTTGWLNYRMNHPFALPVVVPTPANRRFKRARRTVQETIRDIITDRRRAGGEHDDFLQMLLELRYEDTGEGLTDEQIINEAATFFFAGHETTANTLTWAFYLLSQHPDAAARLHTELNEVLNGRSATIADLPDLPYTRRVIEESMRLYPAAWTISRQAAEDDHIGPHAIPAGASVYIAVYAIHRHPRYWQEPDRFDPDRFLPERSADRPSHAYLPFGTGPRFCIGSQFAMTEAQIVLATIAQEYNLALMPGSRPEPHAFFTLRVRDGLSMGPA